MTKISDLLYASQAGLKSNKPIKNSEKSKGTENTNFAGMIKDFINTVNSDQIQAAQNVNDIVEGKSENLVEAMTSMREAQLSFQLLLEIRNKLLESYQELQRMQI